MKQEIKNQIIESLEVYMELHGMSANEVAKKAGVNASYLSIMRTGNFTMTVGNNQVEIADKYFESIANLTGYSLVKVYGQTVATPQLKRIIASLEGAKEMGYTSVLIGETGSGKTFTVDIFARSYPLDCFIITVGSQDNMGDLLEKITDKIGITTEKTKSRTVRAITRKLKSMRSDGLRPMLIFDESEYMKQPALCNMKEMYDHLYGVSALVLIGTEQLIKNIEKMRKKNRDGMPQLYRRIKFGILHLPQIDKTFKHFLNAFLNTELDPDVIRFIRENCENYGEIHDVLVPAMREADRLGQPLTENLIRTILNMPKL